MNKIVCIPVAIACLAVAVPAQAAIVTLRADFSPHTRATQRDTSFNNIYNTYVGRLEPNNWLRAYLEFDLSSIPDSATITSASLNMRIREVDAGSAGNGEVGADGIRVYQLTETFDGNDMTYNQRDVSAAINWTTAGGTFDSTPLSIIASPTAPEFVTVGEVFAFGSTTEFISAVSGTLSTDQLQLILRTPSLESGYTTRKLYRFGGENSDAYFPQLVVEYTPIPEPSTMALLALGGVAMLRRRKKWK